MQRNLDRRRGELAQLGAAMAALSPLAVLDRGYAMVRDGDAIVRDAAVVAPGATLEVRLAKGRLAVTVDAATPEDDT
jgi:exodeoxyribonuclease VII large subunit